MSVYNLRGPWNVCLWNEFFYEMSDYEMSVYKMANYKMSMNVSMNCIGFYETFIQ